MKACLFAFSILIVCTASAQTISGLVIDKSERPIQFAEVFDTLSKNKTLTNELGLFELVILDSFALEISHPQYAPEFFSLQVYDDQTMNATYVLREQIQLVDEVIISSERMKTVVDQKDVNVIDYIPFDLATLTLKSHKRKRYLSIEGLDTTFRSFPITFSNKVNELYIDCFENIHLLSEDSAYQIWMDATLEVAARISIKDFNAYVRPCIANFDTLSVFQSFSNHNKYYQVSTLKKGEGEPRTIFTEHDEVAEQVAQTAYNKIIHSYHRSTPDYLNVIKLGTWTGNLVEIASPGDYVWYTNIRAAELNIKSFRYKDEIYVMSQHSDTIYLFTPEGELLRTMPYSFWKGSTTYDVLFDRASGTFYEINLDKGQLKIVQLPINTDEPAQLHITESPFCKNIKIHQGWVYFMLKQNDFYQINRIFLNNKS
jgi:hypothetical protein